MQTRFVAQSSVMPAPRFSSRRVNSAELEEMSNLVKATGQNRDEVLPKMHPYNSFVIANNWDFVKYATGFGAFHDRARRDSLFAKEPLYLYVKSFAKAFDKAMKSGKMHGFQVVAKSENEQEAVLSFHAASAMMGRALADALKEINKKK